MQANTHEMMLPSLQQYEIGTSEVDRCRGSIFGPWSPCERLTAALAGRGAPLGVGVVGQTFPWRTFTPYSLPGFLAHAASGQAQTIFHFRYRGGVFRRRPFWPLHLLANLM
jgi:hypothetical protein